MAALVRENCSSGFPGLFGVALTHPTGVTLSGLPSASLGPLGPPGINAHLVWPDMPLGNEIGSVLRGLNQ